MGNINLRPRWRRHGGADRDIRERVGRSGPTQQERQGEAQSREIPQGAGRAPRIPEAVAAMDAEWKRREQAAREEFEYYAAFHDPAKIRDACTRIKKKIKSYTTTDLKKRGGAGDLTLERVWELLLKQNFRCYNCGHRVLLFGYGKNCCYQFSVDRIDNSRPHDCDNVLISCYYCNCVHVQRYELKFKICTSCTDATHRQPHFDIPNRLDTLRAMGYPVDDRGWLPREPDGEEADRNGKKDTSGDSDSDTRS